MPISDPRNVFFYPILMMDSYCLLPYNSARKMKIEQPYYESSDVIDMLMTLCVKMHLGV